MWDEWFENYRAECWAVWSDAFRDESRVNHERSVDNCADCENSKESMEVSSIIEENERLRSLLNAKQDAIDTLRREQLCEKCRSSL